MIEPIGPLCHLCVNLVYLRMREERSESLIFWTLTSFTCAPRVTIVRLGVKLRCRTDKMLHPPEYH